MKRALIPFSSVVALTLASCGPLPDDSAQTETPEDVESALTGGISYESQQCSPFTISLVDRSMFYARTLSNSEAFNTCVRNTLQARYWNCGDPNADKSKAQQIAAIMATLKSASNNLHFTCDRNGTAAASANYQGNSTTGQHTINTSGQYSERFNGWSGYGSSRSTRYQPWHWRAADMVHEFVHTHDYKHEGGCTGGQGGGEDWGDPRRADCRDPSCRWTTTCLGSGVPPAGMTQSTAGEAQREFCSYTNTGRDDQYGVGGESNVPYIVGLCADKVVATSDAVCGKATQRCSKPNQLRLLSGWVGEDSSPQPRNGACTCVTDPRHVISLSTTTGHKITAPGGGGSNLRTRWTTGEGAWQTLYAIDQNGGDWRNWDPIQLKSFDGQFINPAYRASGTRPTTFQMGRDGLWGTVGANDRVQLRTPFYSSFAYARDDGFQLQPTYARRATTFVVNESRRDIMIYLRGAHRYFMNVDGRNRLRNSTDESLIGWGNPDHQAAAAFWVIDLNGGAWNDGDPIALESVLNGNRYYVSTPSSVSTAQAGLAPEHGLHQHFVVHKVSGSSGRKIAHNDVLTFRNARNRYLTAMPPNYYDSKILSYGTNEGTWQRFTVSFVSQHDRARRTW